MIGYLSPEAVLYECEPWGHTSKAAEICEELYGEHCYGPAENKLLSLGYLVLRDRDAYMNYWTDDGKQILLTDKQLKWISNHTDNFNESVKKDLGDILNDHDIRQKRHSD